jgi:hypothetical protein
MESFSAIVHRRIDEHKQAEAEKLEAERKRIQEEAEAKARAEQERKLEEERARISAEEAEKAKTKQDELNRIARQARLENESDEQNRIANEMAAIELNRKREKEDLEEFKERQAAMIKEASVGLDKGVTLAGPDAGKGILGGPVENQLSWIEPETKPVAGITVGRDEYVQLKRDSQLLAYLKELGVDNWNGWEQACAMLDEYDKKTAYKVKAA